MGQVIADGGKLNRTRCTRRATRRNKGGGGGELKKAGSEKFGGLGKIKDIKTQPFYPISAVWSDKAHCSGANFLLPFHIEKQKTP